MSSKSLLAVTLFAVSTLVLIANPTYAQTLYVSSTNGSNSNNNTCLSVSKPCLTIAYAETQAKAGETISIAAGTYRLAGTGHNISTGEIAAQNNQIFTGPANCNPVTNQKACSAIISGSIVLGPFTTGSNGNYYVTGQTQQGNPSSGTGISCDPTYPACVFPEDLFFDAGTSNQLILQRISFPLTGTFTYSSVSGGTISGTSGSCTATSLNGNGVGAVGTINIVDAKPSGSITLTTNPDAFSSAPNSAPTEWTLSGGTGTATCSGGPIMTTTGGSVSTTLPTLTSSQWLFDYANGIIYIHQNPSGHTVETSVQSTMFASNGAYGITIENLTVEEFASQNVEGGAIDPTYSGTQVLCAAGTQGCGNAWNVTDNYVTLNHSSGVRIGFGMQVTSNYITSNGQFGVGGGTPAGGTTVDNVNQSGVTVQGNLVTLNNYAHVLPDYGAGGIKFGNSAGVIVLDNTVTNNIGDAIHFDVDSVNSVVDGNIISGNYDPQSTTEGSGAGVAIEISQGAVVRNNQISFAGKGGAIGLFSSTSTNMEAYCNVVDEGTGTGPLWAVNGTNRGTYTVEPDKNDTIISAGNYFHHNSLIWSSSTNTGQVGFFLHDLTQTDFFTGNTPPNYNMYYAPAQEDAWEKFVYDNETQNTNNTPLYFSTGNPSYQGNTADQGGTFAMVSANPTYPTISISSPANNTTAPSITVQASGTNVTEAQLYLGPVGTSASEWTLEQTISGAGPFTFKSLSLPTGANEVAVMATDATSGIKTCYAITANGATGKRRITR